MQVAQHVDDLDRAVAFYTELLGAPPTGLFPQPGLAFFDLAGTRLLLERGALPALLYLRVTDLLTRVEELRRKNVVIDTEPHVIFTHTDDSLGPAGADEWHAFIRDSENNLVGITSFVPRPD